jgi:hypothetical protein
VRIRLDENMPESLRRALKVLRVTLAQAPRARFTDAFVEACRLTDWSRFPNGGDWPE